MKTIPNLRGQCGFGVAVISPVDSFRSQKTFKREKPIPSSSVFSNSGLLSLWTGDIYILYLFIFWSLVKLCHQSREITKRKMWQLSSPPSQVAQFDESHFLQITAIVAIRIFPNMTPAKDDIKKEAYFLVRYLFLSYLWKSLSLFDLMGCIWHEAILLDLALMIWWSSL